MNLRYSPELLEEAVVRELLRRESGGDSSWTRDFHIVTDPFYSLDPVERDTRFREACALFFRDLGFSRPIETVVAESAALQSLVQELVLDRATAPSEEEADLHVEPNGTRNVRIRVRVARFDNLPSLEGFIRHEMRHVADMLDPTFQYRPQSRFGARPAEENLVRARLRVLWNLSAAGALDRAGLRGAASREEWGGIVAKLYPVLPQGAREKIVERFWTAPGLTWPRLIELARRPDHLLEFSGVPEAAPLYGPGALCPLCQFPTFAWGDLSRFSTSALALVRTEFPGWTTSRGACRQCADGYSARSLIVSASAV
ncbi:MAG: hypothetical protein K8T20_20775 [Planctomycetes bacterium]|nr:hypothetical protein [Planctomycetota bacterium]